MAFFSKTAEKQAAHFFLVHKAALLLLLHAALTQLLMKAKKLRSIISVCSYAVAFPEE